MFGKLKQNIESLELLNYQLSAEREQLIAEFAQSIKTEINNVGTAKINFICTHNSRRSMLSQFWAFALAEYHSLNIQVFSGGVEVTECNPRIISTLLNQGAELSTKVGSTNPVYELEIGHNKSLKLWSKKYDDISSPQDSFIAAMVCSSADVECPFIPNAKRRISFTFDDPKQFDGTPEEEQAYLQSSLLIAYQLNKVITKAK